MTRMSKPIAVCRSTLSRALLQFEDGAHICYLYSVLSIGRTKHDKHMALCEINLNDTIWDLRVSQVTFRRWIFNGAYTKFNLSTVRVLNGRQSEDCSCCPRHCPSAEQSHGIQAMIWRTLRRTSPVDTWTEYPSDCSMDHASACVNTTFKENADNNYSQLHSKGCTSWYLHVNRIIYCSVLRRKIQVLSAGYVANKYIFFYCDLLSETFDL